MTMRRARWMRGAIGALALSATSVIGLAAPASAVTTTLTTLDCVGLHPVHVTAPLTARQVNVLKALVQFIDSHPQLFGTTCTVTP